MSRIHELVAEFCPEGVQHLPLSTPEVARFTTGKQLNRSTLSANGDYPVFNGGINASGWHCDFNTEGPAIIVSQGGASAGFVNYVTSRFWAGAHCYVVEAGSAVQHRYLYHVLKSKQSRIQAAATGAGIPGLSRGALGSTTVPLPPLEVQREIVRILDTFTALEAELEAELEARRLQYAHYRGALLDFPTSGSVTWIPLGKLAVNHDARRRPVTKAAREPGAVPYYGASGVVDWVSEYIFDGDYLLVSEDGANLLARSTPIAFSISGKTWVNNHAHVLEFGSYSERRFVEIYLNSMDLAPFISGATQPKLNQANLNRIPIPVPSLAEQERIVETLDSFDALINDLSVGLPAELAARRRQYEHYRSRLLTFEEAVS